MAKGYPELIAEANEKIKNIAGELDGLLMTVRVEFDKILFLMEALEELQGGVVVSGSRSPKDIELVHNMILHIHTNVINRCEEVESEVSKWKA